MHKGLNIKSRQIERQITQLIVCMCLEVFWWTLVAPVDPKVKKNPVNIFIQTYTYFVMIM